MVFCLWQGDGMNEENGSWTWSTSGPINLDTVGVKFCEPAKYVGGYRFGGAIGVQFNVTTKPCLFHRKMVKLVLGWEWVDL
jgi:hypothetical protein